MALTLENLITQIKPLKPSRVALQFFTVTLQGKEPKKDQAKSIVTKVLLKSRAV